MALDKIAGPPQPPLTNEQRQALEKLHQAAQQMESLFVDMLFKEMRKSAPPASLTGKTSNAEATFSDMLDEKRAESLAKSGSLGIGKILEQQLRSSVLAEPGTAARARVPGEHES
jgi:flagellar protein FlgJ